MVDSIVVNVNDTFPPAPNAANPMDLCTGQFVDDPGGVSNKHVFRDLVAFALSNSVHVMIFPQLCSLYGHMNVTILSSFNPTQMTGLRVSKVKSCHVIIIKSLLVIPCVFPIVLNVSLKNASRLHFGLTSSTCLESPLRRICKLTPAFRGVQLSTVQSESLKMFTRTSACASEIELNRGFAGNHFYQQ